MSIFVPKKIVFIDANVEQYQLLAENVEADTEVVILDFDRDGIEQITTTLAGKTDLESIQIVSHGSEGTLQLGSTQLNSSNLEVYQEQLKNWRKSLSANGDILLYGCNVAQGETGEDFVEQLSSLTGADVAASDDLSGNENLGGDWVLEYASGFIDTPLAFQVGVLEAFTSVLKIFQVTNTNNSGAGSLRQAIIDAGNNSGVDVIDLTGVSGTILLNSSLPTINSGNNIFFKANQNLTIDGQGSYQILSINGAVVGFSGLNFANGLANGGDGENGGGGGLGAGGALFINSGKVSLENVKFSRNRAQGGSSSGTSDGGKDASGENGGSGGGLNALTAAFTIGGGSGGSGGPDSGKNGDNGQSGGFGAGGGAGGGGGGNGEGGKGGFGGNGGFGAGGGGGGGGGYDSESFFDSADWGQGGNGGSGGSYGSSGTGGNDGRNRTGGLGGRGAGIGGALFVRKEASVTMLNTSFIDNVVAAGGNGNGQAQAFGKQFAIEYNLSSTNIRFLDGNSSSFTGLYDPNTYTGSPESASIPTISITKLDASEVSGKANFQFKVVDGNLPSGGVDVYYYVSGTNGASEGNDFSDPNANKIRLTSTQQNFSLNVSNDNFYDPNESFSLELLPAPGYRKATQSSDTVTIIDNEPLISLNSTGFNLEEKDKVNNGEFKVILTETAQQDLKLFVQVSGTGTRGSAANTQPGSDYKLYYLNSSAQKVYVPDNNQITVKQGTKELTLGVEVINDDLAENDETVVVSLTRDPSLAVDQFYRIDPNKSQITVTIRDNEPLVSFGEVVNPSEGFGFGSTLAGLNAALKLTGNNYIRPLRKSPKHYHH